MSDPSSQLSVLQVELAEIFFGLDAGRHFLVAGGAALVASGLVDRPTEDLDLFATDIDSVSAARDDFVRELRSRGMDVQLIHDGPTFCRMVVTSADEGKREDTLVDLAVDSTPLELPTFTVLGPTLAPLELDGRKLLALFDRAEARDFADVYILLRRFGKETLLARAHELDAGFDEVVLASMMRTIDRLDDDEIPLSVEADVAGARVFFEDWAHELG